jgi:hypothetical protein
LHLDIFDQPGKTYFNTLSGRCSSGKMRAGAGHPEKERRTAMDKILRVDMSNLSTRTEAVPRKWAGLGGRALTSAIVAEEVVPTCHPLGENNKLVFAPGMLSGTAAVNTGRKHRCQPALNDSLTPQVDRDDYHNAERQKHPSQFRHVASVYIAAS